MRLACIEIPVRKIRRSHDRLIFIMGISIPALYWNMALVAVGGCCNIGFPSEICLERKSRETTSVHSIDFSHPIVLNLYTEHGSDTAVSKRLADWENQSWLCDRLSFGELSYYATAPLDWWWEGSKASIDYYHRLFHRLVSTKIQDTFHCNGFWLI